MKIRDYSPITWIFERAFRFLQFLPPQIIATRKLGNRSYLTPEHVKSIPQSAERAKGVEKFVVLYVVLDVIAFAVSSSDGTILMNAARVWVILRVVDILQATINVTLFDPLRGRADNRVASRARLVVLGFVNFVELIVCFSTLYASRLQELSGATTKWDAMYFSVITQLTIGYGDIHPQGILRAVAALQGLSGLVFLALVFARTITALPALEEIIKTETREEIIKAKPPVNDLLKGSENRS